MRSRPGMCVFTSRKKRLEGVDWPAVRVSELELFSKAAVIPVLTAAPPSGTVLPGTQVKLSSSPGTAAIYYTTDGTDPVTSETRHPYTEPISVGSDLNIKAVAVDEKGGGVSEVGSFEYRVPKEDLSQYPEPRALTATAEMSSPAGWGNVAGRAIDGNPGTYAQPEQNVLWDFDRRSGQQPAGQLCGPSQKSGSRQLRDEIYDRRIGRWGALDDGGRRNRQ
ncbi:chitobiase/beta-hexosaminidase C-terminal domain-containing protein [Paenibacillus sp. JTLBN-2024]